MMKEYVKPEVQVIDLKPEESLASINSGTIPGDDDGSGWN